MLDCPFQAQPCSNRSIKEGHKSTSFILVFEHFHKHEVLCSFQKNLTVNVKYGVIEGKKSLIPERQVYP